MRDVSIIGVGITPFGVREESLTALGAIACRNALGTRALPLNKSKRFFWEISPAMPSSDKTTSRPCGARGGAGRDTLHPSRGRLRLGGARHAPGVLAVGLRPGGFRPRRRGGEDDGGGDGRDGLHTRRRRGRGGGGARRLHVPALFGLIAAVTCMSMERRARRSPTWR